MQGKSLSHYEILSPLGSGGMGDVYRARDTKLDREVALKVLRADLASDPDRRARFLREAKAVAGLVHPSIVTLHSVDEEGDTLFLTMELIEGPTLDAEIPTGGLRLPRLLELAVPLADAVAFAHRKGVTHRDLKPSNIMIDAHGQLRVLDFGLVKLLERSGDGHDADATLQMARDATADGRILGTAAYMSPEQAQGLPVDHRTDIFSLGVLLYEMATGTRPFQGDTSVSTISSVLKDEPRPISELNAGLPRHLGRIIHKCLAKDPASRYQTAQDLKTDLAGLKAETESGIGDEPPVAAAPPERNDSVAKGIRGWLPYFVVLAALTGIVLVWQMIGRDSAGEDDPSMVELMADLDEKNQEVAAERREAAVGGRTLIAVLPFSNLGSDEDAYFAEGVTEELISRLASVDDLAVIAKQSSARYAASGLTLAEIGEELGVTYVIDGSIRWDKSGDGPGRVRVTPHLTRVSDETQLWSDRYEESVAEIFAVQDRIADNIVTALGEALGGTLLASGEGTSTDNFEAHRLYLEALAAPSAPGAPDWDPEVIPRLLDRALELDPGFVEAWLLLSRFHSSMVHYSVDVSEERRGLAREAADRVAALAPDSRESHLALGYYYYHGRKQYDRALEEFEATGLLDTDSEVMEAVAYVNRRLGDFPRALELLEQARVLDPANTGLLFEIRGTYEAMKRFDDAERVLLRTIELDPDLPWNRMALGFLRTDRTGDVGEMRKILEDYPDPDFPFLPFGWVYVHMLEGNYEEALAAVDRIPVPVFEVPDAYIPISTMRLTILDSMGDPRAAEVGEEALAMVEAAVADQPNDWRRRLARGFVYALLDRREDALRDAQIGADMMPISRDALFGVDAFRNQAFIRIEAGDVEGGVAQLRELLAMPYSGLTPTNLGNDFTIRRHRDHPAVRALLDQAS